MVAGSARAARHIRVEHRALVDGIHTIRNCTRSSEKERSGRKRQTVLEDDKKQPSYQDGRLRDPSLAARQRSSGVRSRLMQMLRAAVRKREPGAPPPTPPKRD